MCDASFPRRWHRDRRGPAVSPSAAILRSISTSSWLSPTYAGGVNQVWTELIEIFSGNTDSWGRTFRTPRPSFSVGSNTYQIDAIYTATMDVGQSLVLDLRDVGLTLADKSRLTLHVCDQAYPLVDADAESGDIYLWLTNEDWSTYYSRDVYLSYDPNAPLVRSLHGDLAARQ